MSAQDGGLARVSLPRPHPFSLCIHPFPHPCQSLPTSNLQLLDNCLTDAEYSELPGFCRNKVRDAYRLSDRRRLLIATDRQSAFDQVLAAVPYTGV
jgi:SAICAR synthetase